MALFLETVVNNNIDEYQSSVLYKQYTDYLTTNNLKGLPTLTKFIVVKKVFGITQKRKRIANYICCDIELLKSYLMRTYKFEFDFDDYENDTNISPLDA